MNDPMLHLVLLFGVTVMVSHFLEGITGFGCTALAMPFSVMLIGIERARLILTLYAFLLAIFVVFRSYKKIDWPVFKKIMLLLLPGLPIGILLYGVLPQKLLYLLLAIFMISISIRGLISTFKSNSPKGLPEKLSLVLVFLGGIIHGAFSSGGPLVITYASEKIKDKGSFRVTLCLTWAVLNFLILTQNAVTGSYPAGTMEILLISLPFFLAGCLLGDFAHKKVSGNSFLKLVYILLFVTGVFMVL